MISRQAKVQQRRCQAFILHYCCSCLANSVSLLGSRSAAYAEYNRLMIEGSRCKRRPISLTLALPHSRARYTNIDLRPLTHFRCGCCRGSVRRAPRATVYPVESYQSNLMITREGSTQEN